ncbi:MAG: TRAP transporter small permease [Lautropia sp.]
MIRRLLDGCYLASGVLGALSMILLALVVLAQVVGRLMQVQLRGTDDFTAWLMAAGACLPLAYAFRYGTHIRVSLLLERLTGAPRRRLEIFCLVVAAATAGLFAYAALDLVYGSWRFNEMAAGLVPIPLWIPQVAMALGAVLLLVAVVDDLVQLLSGRRTSYQQVSSENTRGALERAIEEM